MVVGFERTSYREGEDVGQFQVCVVVTTPSNSQPLDRTFSLSVSTRPGTAGTYLIQYSMRYTAYWELNARLEDCDLSKLLDLSNL